MLEGGEDNGDSKVGSGRKMYGLVCPRRVRVGGDDNGLFVWQVGWLFGRLEGCSDGRQLD